MNISLRQLKAFILVGRLGNFTRAAERLHISQAGLSVMMRELETQLGSRLFDRTTRTVGLTDAGEKLMPAALSAVAQLEEAASTIGAIGFKAKHNLRLAATPLMSSSLLPAVCGLFHKRHPNVAIQLTDSDPKRVHALVESGEVDFGLGFFFKAARGIERSLLCSFQLMRVAPLKKAAKQPVSGQIPWSALKDTALIGLPSDNPIQQLVEQHLKIIGRDDEDHARFTHFDTLIAMVAAGMGSTIIPTFALLACRNYPVRTDLLIDPIVTLGFYCISKRGRAKPELMTEFTDSLVAMMPRLINPDSAGFALLYSGP